MSGFVIFGAPVQGCAHSLDIKIRHDQDVGVLSEFVYSPRFVRNIGAAMLSTLVDPAAEALISKLEGEVRDLAVKNSPFTKENTL
ncbi:MAG: glycine cleavage system aminomethyltransferase T [Paracoccaceae bacterium]|jgi:glycine cleavage system aminomethyltransferase T